MKNNFDTLLMTGPHLSFFHLWRFLWAFKKQLCCKECMRFLSYAVSHNWYKTKSTPCWFYGTCFEWQRQFPFWSASKITSLFDSLEQKKLLASFYQASLKRKHYTLDYEALQALTRRLPFAPLSAVSLAWADLPWASS